MTTTPRLTTEPAHTASASHLEQLISQLLIGFAERTVAAQTIVDVLKAQLVDTRQSANNLSVPTTNGLLEVLTSTFTAIPPTDAIISLTSRSDFPAFLSSRAAFGLTSLVLRNLPYLVDKKELLKAQKFTKILDAVIYHIGTPNMVGQITAQERTRIINALKAIPDDLKCNLFTSVPSLESLKRLCGGDNNGVSTSIKTAISATSNTSPAEAMHSIISTPDHTLAQRGVTAFRPTSNENALEWKAQNVALLVTELEKPDLSPFRRGFLSEWFFDGMLREVLYNEHFGNNLQNLMKTVLATTSADEAILKGALRALQRDLSVSATELNKPGFTHPQFAKLMLEAANFHGCSLTRAEQNLSSFTKQFAHWALQMPVHPEESRLFTRESWQWMRTLCTKQWEDDLRKPPTWIEHLASRFTATIVSIAPSFWLQEHLHCLVEKLHQESTRAGFVHTSQHLDYVEFICRTLRKKSPTFAARPEMLLVLRFLGRTSPHEDSQIAIQETRFRMGTTGAFAPASEFEKEFLAKLFKTGAPEDRFGATPFSRALHVLLHTCRITSQTSDRRPKS